MNMQAFWLALYAGSFFLILNGFAEMIGELIKKKLKWVWNNHVTSLTKIILGIILLIVSATNITINIFFQ
jgi:hypothetical protein